MVITGEKEDKYTRPSRSEHANMVQTHMGRNIQRHRYIMHKGICKSSTHVLRNRVRWL